MGVFRCGGQERVAQGPPGNFKLISIWSGRKCLFLRVKYLIFISSLLPIDDRMEPDLTGTMVFRPWRNGVSSRPESTTILAVCPTLTGVARTC